MAKYNLSLLLLSLTILLIVSGVTSCRRCSKTRAFINYSCSTTRYPKVCEQTLSGYVNSTNISHEELAQITLRASLARARFARAYLTKLASNLKKSPHVFEYRAIGSCIDQINDSVAQLRQSLLELQKYSTEGGVDDFMWHMSNVVTWASTALTDQTECAQAFSGSGRGKSLRNVIKAKVNDVSHVTSNALALVNRFVTRRRFAHRSIHKP
ncbi:pectinesterase inhibitor 9-like [Silene latifolia]|uniref:pectinesterase inhibitor 9-like n=1 Tax=Silene latifolia TaxID=37657 RepID=UPI003D785514